MGMSFSPMYQPVTTRTIKADGDMNISPYDLLCTDVHTDTVEATEFVGGVGNFTSGLYSGGVDVSGILHAENTLQVDGNLMLEGALNNVNFGTSGDIVTAGNITASDGFSGNLKGFLFVPASYSGTSGDFVIATQPSIPSNSVPAGISNAKTITFAGLQYSNGKISNGVYVDMARFIAELPQTITLSLSKSTAPTTYLYYKKSEESNYKTVAVTTTGPNNLTIDAGTYNMYSSSGTITLSSVNATNYYVTFDSP